MVFFWSANFIVGKVALREFPPVLLGGLRIALAGLFVTPFFWWKHRNGQPKPVLTKSDLPLLLVLGTFGVALNQIFFIVGLNRTSVTHSALIIAMTPILVLLIAAFIGQERITARKAAGMAIAVGGVAVLNAWPSSQPAAAASFEGDLLILLAALTFALFTVYGKTATERHDSVTVNTVGWIGGALAVAPLTFWHAHSFAFERVSVQGWVSLVYMALFPSVICYLIYYYALKWVAASRIAAFSYIQPVLASLMAVFLLGEPVTPQLVAGGAVIFSGVYLAERG